MSQAVAPSPFPFSLDVCSIGGELHSRTWFLCREIYAQELGVELQKPYPVSICALVDDQVVGSMSLVTGDITSPLQCERYLDGRNVLEELSDGTCVDRSQLAEIGGLNVIPEYRKVVVPWLIGTIFSYAAASGIRYLCFTLSRASIRHVSTMGMPVIVLGNADISKGGYTPEQEQAWMAYFQKEPICFGGPSGKTAQAAQRFLKTYYPNLVTYQPTLSEVFHQTAAA